MKACWLALGLMCGVAMGQAAPAPAVAAAQTKAVSKPEAAALVQQGYAALQKKDLVEAQKRLDAAKALNPEEPKLWAVYGFLEAARGNKEAAIADLQKELAADPEMVSVYRTLAELQGSAGRRSDEEETLRMWLAKDKDPAAAGQLVHLLVADGKAAEAVKLGQDAMDSFTALAATRRVNPRSGDPLAFELGKAQAAAGMKAEASATTIALMKVTANPTFLNDGAYQLAVEGTELPLAERGARAAVAAAERVTQQATVDNKPEQLQNLMDQVSAFWDTLAWVLFKENKLGEALQYERPAWILRPSAAVTEHLAEIDAAKGDKNVALTVCEGTLAKAANAKPGDADVAALQKEADDLRKAGAVSKGAAGVREMLTIPGGVALGQGGSGQYLVQFEGGVVQLVNATSKTNSVGLVGKLQGMVVSGVWPEGSTARLFVQGTFRCNGRSCSLLVLQP